MWLALACPSTVCVSNAPVAMNRTRVFVSDANAPQRVSGGGGLDDGQPALLELLAVAGEGVHGAGLAEGEAGLEVRLGGLFHAVAQQRHTECSLHILGQRGGQGRDGNYRRDWRRREDGEKEMLDV